LTCGQRRQRGGKPQGRAQGRCLRSPPDGHRLDAARPQLIASNEPIGQAIGEQRLALLSEAGDGARGGPPRGHSRWSISAHIL